MQMNRRAFFKVLGATLVVAAVPTIAKSVKDWVPLQNWAKLFGDREFGAAVLLTGKWEEYAKWTSEFLMNHARKALGKGVTVSIRVAVPHDYGRGRMAAWYTNSKIAGSEPTGLFDLKMNELGGYWDAGSVRT